MGAEGPVDEEGGTDKGFFRDGAEEAAVLGGKGVVAERQEFALVDVQDGVGGGGRG